MIAVNDGPGYEYDYENVDCEYRPGCDYGVCQYDYGECQYENVCTCADQGKYNDCMRLNNDKSNSSFLVCPCNSNNCMSWPYLSKYNNSSILEMGSASESTSYSHIVK